MMLPQNTGAPQGAPQGMPPVPQGAPQGADPLEANRSVLNPMDATAMLQKGTINQNMTIKDFIENVLKVPGGVDAPLPALLDALNRQRQNASGIGKMHNIAQQTNSQPRGMAPQMPPQGNPQAAPTPPTSGLAGLVNNL